MSCICQYFTPLHKIVDSHSLSLTEMAREERTSTCTSEVSATELANSRAEIWVLKKQLKDSEISIANLEKLVTTIVDKQRDILSETHDIRTENKELQEECRLQREYHTMERNALIRELHEVKLLLQRRTDALDESETRIEELTCALQEANKKIYAMGIRFLQYKSKHSLRSGNGASPTPSQDCAHTPADSE